MRRTRTPTGRVAVVIAISVLVGVALAALTMQSLPFDVPLGERPPGDEPPDSAVPPSGEDPAPGDEPSPGEDPPDFAVPPSADEPPGHPGPPSGHRTLEEYLEACERFNDELPEAALAFQQSMQIALDDSDLVQAAVSLDATLPPERLIEGEDVASAGVIVSCTIEARLRGGQGVFEVEEPGWLSQSLLTSQTVRWSWFVTPKRLGEHHLTLQFRPVLRIADGTDQVLTEASILEESILVTVVDPSLGDRVVRWLESTARVLRTLEGVLLAFAAVLVAVAAVKTGMWWRERHRQDSARRPGTGERDGLTQVRSPENGQPTEPGEGASSPASVAPSPDTMPTEMDRSAGSSSRPGEPAG